MTESPEDRMDALLREAAQQYNAPPPVPRAEIWARVSAAKPQDGWTARRLDAEEQDVLPLHRPIAQPSSRRAVQFAIGIAALLALGVAIGRYSAPSTPATPVAAVPPSPSTTGLASATGSVSAAPGSRERGKVAAELATTQHLDRAESFLTEFNTRQAAQDFAPQAQELLSTTRLLLDSKRLSDPRTRRLLEDLELVLIQIATLNPKDRREELDFIADGLAQSHLRARLRSAIPTGPIIRM
jgi:hypothetical protein